MNEVWVITSGDTIHGMNVRGVALSESARDEVMAEASRFVDEYFGGGRFWQAQDLTDSVVSWRDSAGGYVYARLYPVEGEESDR